MTQVQAPVVTNQYMSLYKGRLIEDDTSLQAAGTQARGPLCKVVTKLIIILKGTSLQAAGTR